MSVTTEKTVNLAQLDAETGGGGLSRTTLDGVHDVESLADVSDAALQAAIDTHVAGPEDTRTVDQKLEQSGLTLAELSDALGL